MCVIYEKSFSNLGFPFVDNTNVYQPFSHQKYFKRNQRKKNQTENKTIIYKNGRFI